MNSGKNSSIGNRESRKCVLVFKVGKDPRDARVGADGSVDWRAAKLMASDDDFRAAEVAREVGSEVVGLTLGDGDTAWAAARGAVSTVLVADAQPTADAATTAAVLAAGVRQIGGAELVLVGDSAWDPAIPALLGAQLGWPTLAGVLSVKVDGTDLTVMRRTAAGAQAIAVDKPAVLGVVARNPEETPPGMKEVLMARKKPVIKLTMQELGLVPGSSVRVLGTALPSTPPAQIFDGTDPAAAAERLITALRSEGVL